MPIVRSKPPFLSVSTISAARTPSANFASIDGISFRSLAAFVVSLIASIWAFRSGSLISGLIYYQITTISLLRCFERANIIVRTFYALNMTLVHFWCCLPTAFGLCSLNALNP
ncbi:exported protein of unknown function (plasmid) [Ralstonia solanacearum CMR15]|nr:exported protein of unknown function [Ralstonia solanacearum CMR15]